MNDSMKKLMEQYPENFTGETLVAVPISADQHAVIHAQMDELKALSEPLVEWIRENYGPYTEIRITWDRVDVEQHIMGVPFPYSEK